MFRTLAGTLLLVSKLVVCYTFDYADYGELKVVNLNSSTVIGHYNYAKAKFGPDLPGDNHLKGILHRAMPEDGCERLTPPNFNFPLPEDLQWIAIIRRSDKDMDLRQCTFIEKVLNAQKSGYKAVIIYDYKDDSELVPMYASNDSQINMVYIPSVFVGMSDGLDMASFSFPDITDVMTSAEFEPFDDGELNPYKILIPMAFSFVGILLVAVIVMIVRWCQAINRRRRSRISKSQLKKLPLVKYKKDDQYDCCAICLDDYEEGEKVRLLPCSHTYHQKCIDPWLLKNKRTCPVCKRKVIPRPPGRRPRRNSDSSESSDSDTENTAHNERTPLLPPPAGPAENRLLGAVGGSHSGYGSGLTESLTHNATHMVDVDSEDGGAGLYSYPGTGTSTAGRRASSRRHRSHYRQRNSRHSGEEAAVGSRTAIRVSNTSSDSGSDYEGGDSETDLRRSLLVQVSVTPQSYVGVAHSLQSFTARPELLDDNDTIPPLPPMENPDTAVNQDTISHDQSHDKSGDYTTLHMDVEYNDGAIDETDNTPLLSSGGQNSLIV